MTGDFQARVFRVVRMLGEIAASLTTSASRVARLSSSRASYAIGGAQTGDYTPPTPIGVWHDLYAFGACYGNLPVALGDVFVYGVRQDSSVPANWSYYLSDYFTLVDGYARVLAPNYDPIHDGNGNYLPTVVPIAVVLSSTYAYSVVGLDANLTTNVLIMSPLGQKDSVGYAVLPAVYVNGVGSGAAIMATSGTAFNIQSRGSGYGLDTAISLGGYYGTGWGVVPEIGFVSGATIDDAGSGNANGANTTTALPIGHNATIRGVVGNAHGAPSWNIIDGGANMGANGSVVNFVIPAPGGPGTKRTPSVTGVVSGNAVSSLKVYDPGLSNSYTPGTTITGVATQLGSGGSVGYFVVSGAIDHITGGVGGHGYYLGAKASPFVDGIGPFARGKITPTVTKGIGQIDQVSPPDLYGCFGTIGYPSKLTGVLASRWGTSRLMPSTVGLQAAPTCRQVASGTVINDATSPNNLYPNPAYYAVDFSLARDAGAIIRYTLTFSSGVLVSIGIVNAGYGYPSPPSVSIPTLLTGDAGSIQAGNGLLAFHFTLDGSGGAGGYVIDNAGSGYHQVGSGTPYTGTVGVFTLYDSPGALWALTCKSAVALLDDGTGLHYWPVATGSLASATVLPSSYSGLPLFASYDFAGTAVDTPIFQGGATTVTIDGS